MRAFFIMVVCIICVGCSSNPIKEAYSIEGTIQEVLYYYPGSWSTNEVGKYLVVWPDKSKEIWSTSQCMVAGEKVYKPCEEYIDGTTKCFYNKSFIGDGKYTKIKSTKIKSTKNKEFKGNE